MLFDLMVMMLLLMLMLMTMMMKMTMTTKITIQGTDLNVDADDNDEDDDDKNYNTIQLLEIYYNTITGDILQYRGLASSSTQGFSAGSVLSCIIHLSLIHISEPTRPY